MKDIIKKNKKELIISFFISLLLLVASIYIMISTKEKISIFSILFTFVFANIAAFIFIKRFQKLIRGVKERIKRKKEKKEKKQEEKEYPLIEGEKKN